MIQQMIHLGNVIVSLHYTTHLKDFGKRHETLKRLAKKQRNLTFLGSNKFILDLQKSMFWNLGKSNKSLVEQKFALAKDEHGGKEMPFRPQEWVHIRGCGGKRQQFCQCLDF